MDRAALAARLRVRFLERAPGGIVHCLAASLAWGRPLGLDASWHFRIPTDDEPQLTLLRRDIWAYYRDKPIERPVLFRWHDRLRVRLFLGNDLSLCLYVLGAFEPNEFVFLRDVLEQGMVVLDGGANEGLFSLYSARRVGRDGTVIAVEPSTREFARLRANLALNRLDNVKAVRLALGSRVGETVLAIAQPRHAGMNAISSQVTSSDGPVWTETEEAVPLETIDALVARCGLQRLDFVKLDVEGSEVDALQGAYTAISRFRPTILLEAEEVRLASQGRTKAELAEVVAKLGYGLWVFDSRSGQLRPAQAPAEPEGNAIAAPRGWRPPVLR